jgi:hypothetical protein
MISQRQQAIFQNSDVVPMIKNGNYNTAIRVLSS